MNGKAVHRSIEAVGSVDITRYVLARWRPSIRLAFTDCL